MKISDVPNYLFAIHIGTQTSKKIFDGKNNEHKIIIIVDIIYLVQHNIEQNT